MKTFCGLDFCFVQNAENLFLGCVHGNLDGKALVARDDFHNALFDVPGADNDPERNAKQVGIGEHDAGADLAIVVQNIRASVPQCLIQMVRSRFHGFVVGPDGTEMNFPRCNGCLLYTS